MGLGHGFGVSVVTACHRAGATCKCFVLSDFMERGKIRLERSRSHPGATWTRGVASQVQRRSASVSTDTSTGTLPKPPLNIVKP
jgi:hypothetical protein